MHPNTNIRYSDPQMPSPYSSLDTIFNRTITHDNFCGYIPETELTPKVLKGFDSLATLDPAQLGRYFAPPHYVLGYADPAFSGGEYTRGLSFHDYKAREELYKLKHDDMPLIYNEDDKVNQFHSKKLFSHIEDNIDSDNNNNLLKTIDDPVTETSLLKTSSPYNGTQPMNDFKDSIQIPDMSIYRNEYIDINSNAPKTYYNYLSKPTDTVPYSDIPLYPEINFVETKNPFHEKDWSKVNPSETFVPSKETFIPSKDRMRAMTIGLKNKERYTNHHSSNASSKQTNIIVNPISRINPIKTKDIIPDYDIKDKTINLNKNINFNIKNATTESESLASNERFEACMKGYLNNYKQPERFESNTSSNESDINKDIKPFANEQYLDALKTRAMALCYYLQNNPAYKRWKSNWKLLENNLHKTNLSFNKLKDDDEDIAYVINKGDEISFRIHDLQKYVPINVYQYVLYHEMAHMSTEELQHTDFFHKLLSIISLAAYELGFIDLRRISFSYYNTNNQPILSKDSLKEEIVDGCYYVGNESGRNAYYDKLAKHIKSF